MITRDRVLEIVKRKPSIPNEIRMQLGEGDTYVIGAMLSELVKAGLVRISSTKRGSSPFYYAKGNDHQLESLFQYLNDKDRVTAEMIKGKKVLEDRALDALTRVSLRQIKDFAKPVEVSTSEGNKLYFKYFLVPNSEAENIIKQGMGSYKAPEPQKIEETRPEVKQYQKEEGLSKAKLGAALESVGFEEQIESYFENKGISIVEKEVIRKKSELDYIVLIPSQAGELKYYVKARNKKKFNDKDLSGVYVEAGEKKLPALFLITGELTKKAQEMLNTKFTNITVNTI